ncbi:DUF6448 family protein [Actinoplanes sp. NPDC024001]|uniref:DUF6448 family protein n=1 Tax=Actinoplanes sp. NPDC024001 TaxID=3154598 RepID=UPI0033C4F14C
MPPHCDSLDGPVVTAAREALTTADVELVLPYVPAGSEDEIRNAFDRVSPLQQAGGEPAALARQWFFETVVRLHRAGENAPYTGLKPAGLDVGPVIPLAERAVATGDVEEVYRRLTVDLHAELTRRLRRVRDLAAARRTSVAAAREYVDAMLAFEVFSHRVYRMLHAGPRVHAG